MGASDSMLQLGLAIIDLAFDPCDAIMLLQSSGGKNPITEQSMASVPSDTQMYSGHPKRDTCTL